MSEHDEFVDFVETRLAEEPDPHFEAALARLHDPETYDRADSSWWFNEGVREAVTRLAARWRHVPGWRDEWLA